MASARAFLRDTVRAEGTSILFIEDADHGIHRSPSRRLVPRSHALGTH
jgi:hypothetical protein